MADQNYWFPSQTGSYDTPQGAIRFKIHYDDGGAAADTDTNADVLDMGKLLWPMGDNPSGAEVRFAEWRIRIYNTDDVFETESVLNDTYDTATFITVYVGGSEFWKGILDFKATEKDDYYHDGSNLKYREVSILAFDCFKYFWDNDYDLADLGTYSDGMEFEDLLEDIATVVGYSGGNFAIDSNITFDSEDGNTYGLDEEFFIALAPTTLQVSTLLAHVMAGFGCYIYNINGNCYVTARNDYNGTVTVTIADVLKVKEVENINEIDYVKLSGTKDWSRYCNVSDVTYELTSGDSLSENQVEITELDSLGYLFIQASANQDYYSSSLTQDNVTSTYLTDNSENFLSPGALKYSIQSGMIANVGGGNILSPIERIESVGGFTNNRIYYEEDTTGSGATYTINRHPARVSDSVRENRVFKIYQILEYGAGILKDFFANKKAIHMTIKGISDYTALHSRISLDGSYYRIKYARFDPAEDTAELKLLPVS